MAYVVLILLVVALFYFLRFSFKLLRHLFTVFGWIGSDIVRTVSDVMETIHVEPQEDDDGDDDDLDARQLKEYDAAAEDAEKQTEESSLNELSLLEIIFFSTCFIFSSTMRILLGARDFILRVPVALKQPFPVRATVAYVELQLLILPYVILFRVPDVYGYGPIIDAARWGAGGYFGFIFLIYFLRALIPLDIETALQAGEGRDEGPQYGNAAKLRGFLYGVLILVVTVTAVVRLIWVGVFLLGFFYSLLYFFAFRKRGDSRFTFKRFMISWAVFASFVIAAVLLLRSSSLVQSMVGVALAGIVLAAFLFIHVLWTMSRKYEIESGLRELPVRQIGSWLRLFVFPVVKLAYAVPVVYFIALFFAVNTIGFFIGVAASAALFTLRYAARARLARYVPGGIFAAYVFLAWLSIFYVQSYNRIPPEPETCASIPETETLKTVWTMDDFRRYEFLDNALPYDAIIDARRNKLFISFKNFTKYGAIAGVNLSSGKLESHIVTENLNFPGGLLYPERFCINRDKRRLYATTKSRGNFQLLSVDYSGDEMVLESRVPFPDVETTNCEISPNNDDIFVIYLGPPDSHLRVLDGGSHEEKASIHFGRFGYADYFAFDSPRDRMIVPSLDPKNRFRVYEVSGIEKYAFKSRERAVGLEFAFQGDRKLFVPLPTLGVDVDSARNLIYFTSPFFRLVLEVDGETFKVKRRLTVGRFPREIAFHDKLNLLFVANYGDGTVDVIDTVKWKIVRSFKVGKLVRSITIDPSTGRTFIVTACGVFEPVLPL